MSDESRYILAKKIARGGMAEIYLGKHVGEDGFQRLCAIKRILPHYAQDKEFIEMFRDEAHICKRLQHANIVRVEGFEEVEGSYAIIMEFVDGPDLRSLLGACEKGGVRLSTPMAAFIAAEAARGLHYAHTKLDEITQQPLNIVHRDISPQNILLSYEGEVKITDFGIADAGSKITETKPGIVKGKYSYMSPEQISAKQVDARTDVFALAIVLWEMLAMKRLFQGENEVDTINIVRACKIPYKLTELNPEVDEELEQIVVKALSRDIRKRPPSAGDFERELKRYINKKHPSFTATDLGAFLKTQLAARRDESAADIKKTLTATNLKPQTKGSKSSNKESGESSKGESRSVAKGVDLEGPATAAAAAAAAAAAMAARKGKGAQQSGVRAYGGSSASQPSGQLLAAPGISGMNVQGHGPHGAHPGTLGSLATPRSGLSIARTASRANSPPSPLQFRRPKSSAKPMIAWIAVLLLIFGGALGWHHYGDELMAKKPTQLVLTTTPETVRIVINGKRQFDGAFKRTPVGLNLPAGKHVITIQRPGYESEVFEVSGDSGQTIRKDDIVLEAKDEFAPTRIVVVNQTTPQVVLDIGGGFAGGVISRGRDNSLAVTDLVFDRSHRLRVRIPATGKQFACDFTPRATNWRLPAILTVDVATTRCNLRNPRSGP